MPCHPGDLFPKGFPNKYLHVILLSPFYISSPCYPIGFIALTDLEAHYVILSCSSVHAPENEIVSQHFVLK
jgi:hypothetical protein